MSVREGKPDSVKLQMNIMPLDVNKMKYSLRLAMHLETKLVLHLKMTVKQTVVLLTSAEFNLETNFFFRFTISLVTDFFQIKHIF
jgi:hypothetical protein